MGVFKEAWSKVKGMKKAFWGGSFLVAAVMLGGITLLGIFLLASQLFFIPNFLTLYAADPAFLLDPNFVIPAGMIVCYLIYHIAQALFEMFVFLPMRMGLRLIPLRQAAAKSVHSLFVFKYITWKYIWRFIALNVLVILAVGIPAGAAAGLFCLANMHHLGLLLTVACYGVGGLLSLLALYLLVSYTFVNVLVIDRDISAWQAMKLSRQTISKRWFCIFGTLIILGIALTIGTLLFVVGLIWAVPFAHNVIAIWYRNMLGIEGKDPVTLGEVH